MRRTGIRFSSSKDEEMTQADQIRRDAEVMFAGIENMEGEKLKFQQLLCEQRGGVETSPSVYRLMDGSIWRMPGC